jgi:hypothetical protein
MPLANADGSFGGIVYAFLTCTADVDWEKSLQKLAGIKYASA